MLSFRITLVSHITYLSEQTNLSLILHDVCIILMFKRFTKRLTESERERERERDREREVFFNSQKVNKTFNVIQHVYVWLNCYQCKGILREL